jgi:hypothetical protein
MVADRTALQTDGTGDASDPRLLVHANRASKTKTAAVSQISKTKADINYQHLMM